jgi:hypothetical protein
MSLRAALTPLLALTLALTLSSGLSASHAQEESTPPPQEPTLEPQEEEVEAAPEEPAKSWFIERVKVRAGASAFYLRSRVSGTTHREETQLQPYRVEQIDLLHFDSSVGQAWVADFLIRVGRRWYVTADVLVSSPPGEGFTDDRQIGRFDGTDDFTMARFESEYQVDYLEWSVGGAFRAYPLKPQEKLTFYVDGLLQYRKAENEYQFQVGEMVANPFEPSAFFDPRFDPQGRAMGSYDMDFETLVIGAKLGWRLSDRWNMDATIGSVLFAKFEGYADMGPHGIKFEHAQGTAHTQPVFHVRGCDSDDPEPASGTPDCAGLVDGDTLNPSLEVNQESDAGSGLRLALNFDYEFSDRFSLSFGYHYQDLRSRGGTEERIFGDDAAAGCPPSLVEDPNTGQQTQGPPVCTDELGDLNKAAIVTQSLYLYGKFTWD